MSNDAGHDIYSIEWPLLSAVCRSRSTCTVDPQEVFCSHMNKIKQRRSEQKALYKVQRQVLGAGVCESREGERDRGRAPGAQRERSGSLGRGNWIRG